MSEEERLKKKLHNMFKLSGFIVRKEFCTAIIEKFKQEKYDLNDGLVFENAIRNICDNLEKQCLNDQSIEKEHINRAIEVSLHAGYDKYETVFDVINAFEFPKFNYNLDRKCYLPDPRKSTLLSNANSKTQLFLERYSTILQRVQRNFKNKIITNDEEKLSLQTVDYLLTLSNVTLDRTLILGSLLQVSEGKYYLEDPTGIIELDLSHANYHGGFFVENMFVLVNGYYESKILHVSTVILPPGEEYKDSKPFFGSKNYFGGGSFTPLRESYRLKDHLNKNQHGMILFFSDVWLDYPEIFEKFQVLFKGMEPCPPIAFVFMGNFLSESHGAGKMEELGKLFKQLGQLISLFPSLIANSQFVFVPGNLDPSTPHLVPRLPLPNFVTKDFIKYVPNAIATTNPCRIQYCTREIILFRADILAKLMQGTLHKPDKDDIPEYITRTIISQGHLSPFSLNALPIHWDFDYTLRLFPLPDLIVIGDKSVSYEGIYKGARLINPGSFCDSGFQFKSYMPFSNTVDDCQL